MIGHTVQLPAFEFSYVIDDGETQTQGLRRATWPGFLDWLDEMADRDLTVSNISCPIERPYSHRTIGTVDIGPGLKDALVEDCLARGVTIREWVTQAVRSKLGVTAGGSLGDLVDADPLYAVGHSQGHRVVLGKFATPAMARSAEASWYRWREKQRDARAARMEISS